MLILGFCVLVLHLSLRDLTGFQTRIWSWALSTYTLNQGDLLELVLGPHRQSQDFTFSECKLGLRGASRALAANKIKLGSG